MCKCQHADAVRAETIIFPMTSFPECVCILIWVFTVWNWSKHLLGSHNLILSLQIQLLCQPHPQVWSSGGPINNILGFLSVLMYGDCKIIPRVCRLSTLLSWYVYVLNQYSGHWWTFWKHVCQKLAFSLRCTSSHVMMHECWWWFWNYIYYG